MKDKELLFEIFSMNKRKCLDLFGKRIKMGKLEDASEKSSRVYINYFALRTIPGLDLLFKSLCPKSVSHYIIVSDKNQ